MSNTIKEFIYEERYSHPYDIALNLTNDCNLACKYCFVEQKPEYMTLDTAIAAVEYAISNLKLHKEIYNDVPEDQKSSIWFFGGEPLLCFNSIIKPLIEYCQNKNYLELFNFSLTTNATLLDKEKVDFFKSINCYPMLSIDGNPKTQDFQRPCKNSNQKSSQLIEKNIPYILEIFPHILFRSTIYQPTINQMFENYLYAESLGFQAINYTPDTRALDWTQNDYNNIKEQLYQIFTYRLYQYQNNQFPMHWNDVVSNYQQILQHDINVITKHIDKSFPLSNCGLGTNSAAIDYQGNIYTCQERPTKDKKNIFVLGNLKNGGINIEHHKEFLTQYINEYIKIGILSSSSQLCEQCLRKTWCTSCCISVSKDLYNNFHTINNNWCLYNQMLIELSLNMMDILVKENNKIFYLDLLKNNAQQYNIFLDYVNKYCF